VARNTEERGGVMKEWIKGIHKELSNSLKDWLKPFLWPLTILIALSCLIITPIVIIAFLFGKYIIDPTVGFIASIFTKETP